MSMAKELPDVTTQDLNNIKGKHIFYVRYLI